MDLSDVQGKLYPQKVILDTSIQTVTGEEVRAGTEICVLLCEQLVVCIGDGDYLNVNVGCSTRITDRFDRIYLNPGNNELFADNHCNGETFKSFNELCCERPRYFSCNKDLFAIDENECIVRVTSGEKLEFKTIQANTSVRKKTKTPKIVLCNRDNCEIQIPSANKCSFQGLEDPNHYTPRELLENFPLPRQVEIIDESLYRLGSAYICSKELDFQSVTTNYFLLFTFEPKTGPLFSGFELRHQVKCCELVDPTAVKLSRRIDNRQVGETFSTIFLFEENQDDHTVFSVIGRHCSTPVTRLKDMNIPEGKTGAHEMSDSDFGFADADLESCASTLTTEIGKTCNTPHFSERNNTLPKQTERKYLRRLSTQEEFINSIDDSDTTSDRSSGEYVNVQLDREETPPLPERTYIDPPIAQDDVQTNSDNYVAGTEPVIADERENTKSEISNKEPENDQRYQRISRPESDLKSITMVELGNLLKNVKLGKFADICLEEQVDGEIFMEMTDEILREEPFSLNRFEILKVTKLKGGWNPK
ncbi:unnamed protein product [Mytilus edulis]|uniref:CABIT domain-containing protein n=1 Tax=Mytilus edulis TaxID=6550 RepID=A0A8S3UVD6_MYTED|nr:unnamed protein product [Mytilus edulis]